MRQWILRTALPAVLLAPALGCARASAVASVPSDEDAIDAAALAAMTGDLPPRATLHVVPVARSLFATDTAARAWAAQQRAMTPAAPAALLIAFARANREPRDVVLPTSVGGHPITLVTADGADAPADVFILTRPGLSAGRDSALIMVTRSCGPLCGRTEALLLVRAPPAWRVANRLWSANH